MKRFTLILALCLASTWVQAAGLPFAVESLKTAQETAGKNPSQHVLVFYTSEN
jgi:hypothetical protein